MIRKFLLTLTILATVGAFCNHSTMAQTDTQEKSLEKELSKKRNSITYKIGNAIGNRKTKDEKQEQKDAIANHLKKGEKAKDFTLKNATGEEINLYDFLKQGPVILTWYRGGWCPYCNLTLRHLQESIPEFESLGANLIALTPELPDSTLTTKEKNDLKFQVLSDIDNKVGKEYGIVFKLGKKQGEKYNKFAGLDKYNGNSKRELPAPATYIIRQDGTIEYVFVDLDYTKRAEPSEIIEVLKTIQ